MHAHFANLVLSSRFMLFICSRFKFYYFPMDVQNIGNLMKRDEIRIHPYNVFIINVFLFLYLNNKSLLQINSN